MQAMENYELIDNVEEGRYEFHVHGLIPLIEYIKTKNGVVHLVHTEVPYALEGQGIGSRLVEKVLEEIERQGMTVVPSCPFVASYIRRHPEWERILAEGVFVS